MSAFESFYSGKVTFELHGNLTISLFFFVGAGIVSVSINLILTDNTTMNISISLVFGDLTFDQRILQNNIHVFFFLNYTFRTDLQLYCISKDGNIDTMKSSSLSDYSLDDYVSFYLGCSFSFEEAMIKAGIPLQNVAEKRNVSMFITNIQCKPAGPFSCPMVVSMRPIPRGLVEKAVIVTAAYDAVHGAPIHVGDPSVIGIDDINNTDFGEPSDIGDLIPMFWACGVTSSLAVRSASKKCFC